MNSSNETWPLRKIIGSTGAAAGAGRRFEQRPRALVSDQPLEQESGLGAAVGRCVGFDAANEIAGNLGPVGQKRAEHAPSDQCVGEIDR